MLRRRLLRVARLAGVAGVAGCLGDGSGSGSQVPEYAAWFPRPARPLVDVRPIDFQYVEFDRVLELHEEYGGWNLPLTGYSVLARELAGGPGAVETEIGFLSGGVAVLESSRSEAELLGAARGDDRVEGAGTHRGYTLFGDSDAHPDTVGVAVSGSRVVYADATTGQASTDAVRYVLDARDGGEPRYADANGAFARLASELGTGTGVGGTVRTNVDAGDPVGAGHSYAADGGRTTIRRAVVYRSADEGPDLDVVRARTEDVYPEADSHSVDRDGRVVTVTWAVDTADV